VTEDAALPERLEQVLDTFALFPDPVDRSNLLISFAERFREVPAYVATRPFPASHQVPQCESDAYVWALTQPDGSLTLHFAVENPSGVSAKALAAILESTLSGLPASDIAAVPSAIVERIFRQNLSMGKGMGLMSMVAAVRSLARKAQHDLSDQPAAPPDATDS
jgi:cysteine desulfuration protein SufE